MKTLRQNMDSLDIFRLLTPEERDELAELSVSIGLDASDIFVESEAPRPGLICVEQGSLELHKPTNDRDWICLDTLRVGAIVGSPIEGDETGKNLRIQAGDSATTVRVLDAARVSAFLGENKKIAKRIHRAREILEIVKFLESSESLRGMPREELWEIAASSTKLDLKAGERLIQQGAEEDTVYLVRSGKMTVTREEAPSVRIVVLRSGDIVGEIAVLQRTPRNANVDAIEDCQCFQVEGSVFRAVAERQSAFMGDIQRTMSERLEKVEREAQEASELDAETQDVTAQPAKPKATDQTPTSPAQRKQSAEPLILSPRKRSPLVKLLRKCLSIPEYPAIQQHSQMDCSAACLVTICKHYGKTVSLNTARDMARVRQEGASMANVIRASNEMGFKTEAYLSSLDQLREKKLPAIANWKGYHWIVVYEVNENSVLVADPAEGLTTYTLDEFIESWSRYTIYMEPTEKFADFPESKPSIRAFLPYFRPHKRTIMELFAATVSLQLLAIVGPLFSKFVIDEVILKSDAQWLWISVMVMCVVLLLNMLMDYVSDIMAMNLAMGVNYNLISDIYRRLLRLPLSFFENRQVGDITNRLEQHEEITQFVTEDGLDTFINLMTAVAFLCIMIYLNGWLALGAVSILFLNLGLVRFISPRLRQLGRESFVKEAAAESHTIESLRGAMTLKTLAADHQARWKYEDHFAAVTNLSFREAKLGQVAEIIAGLIDSLSDIIVLFMGGLLVIYGELTIGGLIAFTVLANGLQDPINALIGKWDEIQEVLVAIERLNDVREKDPEYDPESDLANKIELPSIRGHFQFQNVTFRYDDDDPNNVVQSVNLTIEPGQKVAFVGPSGCGKSTIIKILFGFYQPNEGKIRVDGFDYRDVSLPSLRRQISMVPQESLIFRGSVRDNIGMARPGADLAQIIEASKKADAHDFVTKMNGGYDALLDEQGANLSGGQRQRLNLARAFLRDAPVMVMDEATSALDVETERVIMDNILEDYQDRTVFMIAHRLSTVRKADLIVVLNDGLIVEQGTHDELIAEHGFYYHLSSRQMSVG